MLWRRSDRTQAKKYQVSMRLAGHTSTNGNACTQKVGYIQGQDDVYTW